MFCTNWNGCGLNLNLPSSSLYSTSSKPPLAPYCPTLNAHSSKNSKLEFSVLDNASNNFFNELVVPLS